MKTELNCLLSESTKIIESKLKEYMDREDGYGLNEIMSYSLFAGGKRLRPFIVLESFKLFSRSNDIEKALPYACALELIQTYSLIHDDLPCMDNDDFRRGKPTCHKVYGEDMALLAGDSLLTYAFDLIASNDKVSDKSVRLACASLAKYAGHAGMAGGQMVDLSSEGKVNSYEELKKMHSLKTAALIKCALVLGYLAANDTPNEQVIRDLELYGENVGIAFQIKDDILDVTASEEELGKPIGSDQKNGKTTVFSFMTMEEANSEMKLLIDRAIDAIEIYYPSDNEFHSLTELAKYMIERTK